MMEKTGYNTQRDWTPGEINEMRRLYLSDPDLSPSDIHKIFCGHFPDQSHKVSILAILNNKNYYDPFYPGRELHPPRVKAFWDKVQREGDCLLWQGAKTKQGMGVFTVRGESVYVHRYAYFLEHGIYPQGSLFHTCPNPTCVNTNHLSTKGRKKHASTNHSRDNRQTL